jgi:multidrug efflux pump subunit AcrA (membrane-fusion protein)
MYKVKGPVSAKVLAFILLAVFSSAMLGCGRTQAAAPPPPPEVRVAPVVQQDVPVYSEWVATLDGYVNAQVRPQVSGYIIKQNYKEGSLVHKGEVLFEIDPRPFQAALDRAKGDLAQAQAQLGKSTLDVERDTLAEARAIAKSQLDNEIQAKLGAQSLIESDKAAVEQAELNLEWTKVTSLVDGIAGIAQIQIGNLVGSNSILTSVGTTVIGGMVAATAIAIFIIPALFVLVERLAGRRRGEIPGHATVPQLSPSEGD